MARKKSKKAAPKPAKKGAKKTTKKAAARTVKAKPRSTKPARRPATAKAAAPKTGVEPIGTGGGASPAEIGQALVSAFNAGTPDKEIWDRWFSPHVASIEGVGVGMAWYGQEAVAAKSAEWNAQNRVINASAAGPYVGSTGFAVRFSVEVEVRATGNRQSMDEIGVYTVENGKVVREEFMYKIDAPANEKMAVEPPPGL